MYIKSLKLNNFRNYENLDISFEKIRIFFMGTMLRERQIYWNPYICLPLPGLTEEAKTEK